MTSWYFESTRSRSSSIGGSMMPGYFSTMGNPVVRGRSAVLGCAGSLRAVRHIHQCYDLSRGLGDVAVDDEPVELPLGREFDPRGVETGLLLLRRLGAAADEPMDEVLPARRGEEDERRLGDLRA